MEIISYTHGEVRYAHKRYDMPIDTYLSKVIPYLKILINEKKITEQKIQLDVGINLIHITDTEETNKPKRINLNEFLFTLKLIILHAYPLVMATIS